MRKPVEQAQKNTWQALRVKKKSQIIHLQVICGQISRFRKNTESLWVVPFVEVQKF
jgi:hypothetical protein